MIAVPLLDAHPGGHCKPPSLLAKFFRWVLRGSERKRSVPEVTPVASGTAASPLLMPEWTLSADMPTGAFAVLDEKFEALYRPVNGRYLGTQPRRQPVYGERCQRDVLEAERDAAREAGNRARVRYQPASPELLERVLGGLRGMDVAG